MVCRYAFNLGTLIEDNKTRRVTCLQRGWMYGVATHNFGIALIESYSEHQRFNESKDT